MYPAIVERLHALGLDWLGVVIPTPGAVHGLVAAVIVLLFLRRAKRADLPGDGAHQFVLSVGVGAVIGARLFYLITTGELWRLPVTGWFQMQGTASWGAYLGAMAGAWAYGRWRRADTLPYLDVLASIAGLAHVVGRWSCWLAGDDFGRVTDVPWAITFPAGSLPHQAHVAAGLIAATAPTSLPVHPLQFYFMFAGAAVFWLCTAAWRRWRMMPGATLALFLLATGLVRFPLEFWRDPAAGGAAHGLSVSQVMSLAMMVAGMAMGWPRMRAETVAEPAR